MVCTWSEGLERGKELVRVQGEGLWESSFLGDTGLATPHTAQGRQGGAASDGVCSPLSDSSP